MDRVHSQYTVALAPSSGDKLPQPGWLLSNRNVLLTALEAGCLRSGRQSGWRGALFRVILLVGSPQGRKGQEVSGTRVSIMRGQHS